MGPTIGLDAVEKRKKCLNLDGNRTSAVDIQIELSHILTTYKRRKKQGRKFVGEGGSTAGFRHKF
jgi:hypothetical protein